MTRDVIVTMKGTQFMAQQESDAVELITRGQYFNKKGKQYVLFDEIMEGVDAPVKNVLKFQENCVEITKKGGVNVHMMFEVGKMNTTSYCTPYGNILIGMEGKRIAMQETEEVIELQVDYGMEANYEFLADCSISISLTAAGTKTFQL